MSRAAYEATLDLIARELGTLARSTDDTVPTAEVRRILTVCNAQREMIELGIHTKQMEKSE